jgi:hypothetical protein
MVAFAFVARATRRRMDGTGRSNSAMRTKAGRIGT